MQISKVQLKRIMPNAGNNIDKYLPYLNKHLDEFGINTPRRLQHFIAQVAHESGEFRFVSENLNYSADALLKTFPRYFTSAQAKEYARKPMKIANRVYANRGGNGNEASGDGWKYRGRGFMQLTFKRNYKAYNDYLVSRGMVVDLLANPELLSNPVGAVKSAMWYWMVNGLNELADNDDVTSITKKINGGTNGLTQRRMYLLRAKIIISA